MVSWMIDLLQISEGDPDIVIMIAGFCCVMLFIKTLDFLINAFFALFGRFSK